MTAVRIQNRISELNWLSLPPLQVVGVPYRAEPYRERLVLPNSGGFTLSGIPGPNGELPTISGDGATTDPQFAVGYTPLEANGLISVWKTLASGDVMPGNIVFENLIIECAHPDYKFTNAAGQILPYGPDAGGFYLLRYTNLIIRNCIIRNCSNGIFSGDSDFTKNILIDGNSIYGNGLVGSSQSHGSYVQAIGATYQNNHYGKNRPGALGGSLKDRSSSAVIRNNIILSNNRQVDLSGFLGPTASAVKDGTAVDAGALVQNNLLLNDASSITFVYQEPTRSPVPTKVLNNTMVQRTDHSAYCRPVCGNYDATQAFEVSGNIIDVSKATAAAVYDPDVRIVDCAGIFTFGANFVRTNLSLYSPANTATWTGIDKLIVTKDPAGYKDEANGDYTLVAGAKAAGFGYTASAVVPPPVVPPPPPPVVPPVVPPPPPSPPPVTWIEDARVTEIEGPGTKIDRVLYRKG